jgi:hypothetical protein
MIEDAAAGPQPLRFIANKRQAGDRQEYREKSLDVRMFNHLNARQGAIFLEVEISDASDFETTVHVTSEVVGGHYVLRATGPSVPNVLAAVLLEVRDRMGKPPHAYFEWSQKAPGQNVLRFLIAGEGDVPPLVHEILRRAEPDEGRRPHVHVGG